MKTSLTELPADVSSATPVDQLATFGETWFEIGRILAILYTRLLFDLHIQYDSKLPDGPKILAANHPSTIDPVLLTFLAPERVSILIAERVFNVPYFGLSMRLAGHIEVLCANGKKSIEEGIQALKSGRTIGVFPEGAISPIGGGFQRAHTGVARMALATGVPVVPVGFALEPSRLWARHTEIKGTDEDAAWYPSGPYGITIGEPVTFTGDVEDRELVRSITGEVMQRIAALTAESARRLQAVQDRKRHTVRPIEANLFFKVMRFLLNPV
ncbi:MAG TPA: lysophospholipid acyltransferase family protein [Anaerolineaceae bacterium]|nr:lysophospholipid acyltransferase family protein [Anaerolineaceae bacterium]